MIDWHATAELISLTLTLPTIVTGVAVIILWGRPAVDAIRDGKLSSQGWFVVGVSAGFLGAVLDNLYWSIPWTASYFGSPHTQSLMSSGVYFNIFTRQLSGTFAAYCHLRAAEGHESLRVGGANRIIAWSHIVAVALAAAALSLK